MAFLTSKTISDRLQSMASESTGLRIPPCLLDMEGELLEYEEGVSLTVRFLVLPRYANPLGYMQGGYVVAVLDNMPAVLITDCAAPRDQFAEYTVFAPGNPGNQLHYLRGAVCRVHVRNAFPDW